MKYKIKLIEIDECVEDGEFFVDFNFLDSDKVFQAELFLATSKILFSFLGKEISIDLHLISYFCYSNKEKKISLLSLFELGEQKVLTCDYKCSGKILSIDKEEFILKIESERIIEVKWDVIEREKDEFKFKDFQVGEYYIFEGRFTINSIDEQDEYREQQQKFKASTFNEVPSQIVKPVDSVKEEKKKSIFSRILNKCIGKK